MTLVSIDPGASGGFAWLWPGCKVASHKMPSTDGDIIKLLKAIIHDSNPKPELPVKFYLEDMVKFAGKACSQSTMTVYGANFGVLKGCIQYAGCELNLVSPQAWLKALSLGKRGERTPSQWKNHLKAFAQRTFPQQEVILATADALCILQYAILKNREASVI